MLRSNKLVPYAAGNAPQLPGNDRRHLATELRKLADAIRSTQRILAQVELSSTVSETAGVPTAADVDVGTCKVIHDTVNNTTGLYANINGVLKSVSLT